MIPWRIWVIAGLVVLLVSIQIVYWFNPVTFKDIIAMNTALFHFIENHWLWAVVLYILLFTTIVIFGIPISMTLVGGYLFGFWYGAIFTLIATLLGIMILCATIRYVIGNWIQQHYASRLKPFNRQLEYYGSFYILLIYIVPFMPNFLVHLAAAISTIALYKIFMANVVGALPSTVAYAYLGAYAHHIDSFATLIEYVVLVSILLGILALIAIGVRWVFVKKLS